MRRKMTIRYGLTIVLVMSAIPFVMAYPLYADVVNDLNSGRGAEKNNAGRGLVRAPVCVSGTVVGATQVDSMLAAHRIVGSTGLGEEKADEQYQTDRRQPRQRTSNVLRHLRTPIKPRPETLGHSAQPANERLRAWSPSAK